MALSPWPGTTAAVTLKAALAELREALSVVANTSDPYEEDAYDRELKRLGAAVSAKIEEYAPGAPQACRDEALVRGVAWLRDTAGAVRETGVSSISMEAAPVNTAAWFLHSGAASLLTGSKIRRGGAC